MSSHKLWLWTLGLSAWAMLSLTTLGATNSLAQENLTEPSKTNTPGTFVIDKGLALLATVAGNQEGDATLKIPGRNLSILCASGNVTEGKVLDGEAGLLRVLFEGCEAWNLALTTKLPCTVLTAGETNGSVAAVALFLPILHGGSRYLLMEPDFVLNFAELELHGATCSFFLVSPIKGAFTAEVTPETNNTIEPLIIFSQAIQLLVGDKFTFGGFPIYLNASFVLELTGDHAGSTFGIE